MDEMHDPTDAEYKEIMLELFGGMGLGEILTTLDDMGYYDNKTMAYSIYQQLQAYKGE